MSVKFSEDEQLVYEMEKFLARSYGTIGRYNIRYHLYTAMHK